MIEPLWDERGLAPAVAQDATTGAVLMVAWMNGEALERTRASGEAWFWSRSRGRLWRKGEESGHVLRVREVRVDCDADVLLLQVDPAGPACHTGKPSCFYRDLDGAEDDGPRGAPAAVLDRLARVIHERRGAQAGKSYVKSLLDGGAAKISEKIEEEQRELTAELLSGRSDNAGQVVHEAADLLFHVLVGLAEKDVALADVWRELERRFGTSGHDEKAGRTKAT